MLIRSSPACAPRTLKFVYGGMDGGHDCDPRGHGEIGRDHPIEQIDRYSVPMLL